MLTRRYEIDSVPAIVVNGQYRTNPVLAGGASRILEAVNELVASEQKQPAVPQTGMGNAASRCDGSCLQVDQI